MMMDTRRSRLKELAARSARLWGLMPVPESLAGEARIETRNTVYRLRDGVCYAVQRDDPGRVDPSAFVGMRVVGWLWRDDPRSVMSLEWQPGAYAILWRKGNGPLDRSAVALTSASIAFRQVERSMAVRAAPMHRSSVPPPLPATVQRALARPPTPPSLPVPAPPSTTRLHSSAIPAIPRPPETPTPLARRSSVPPPLPTRARAGVAPRPFRVPAILS
jgi:hypothetical protein